jgi:hypothetical protein
VYEIHLVPTGVAMPRTEKGALRLVDVVGPKAFKIEWRRPGLLLVSYDTAWVQNYTNLYPVIDGHGARTVVEVRLISPNGDESALPMRLRF